jgi:hypothetical protein
MVSILATAIVSVGMLAGTAQPPQWEASYGKALEATRSGGAPLLVVLDKPDSRSARIEPALLSQDSATGQEAELLRPYQLCHVDVTSEYGRKVARAFRADRFPHVAIIDRTGSQVIFRRSGPVSANEWEQILTRHRNGDRLRASTVSRTSYRPVDAETDNPGPPAPHRTYRPFDMGIGPYGSFGGGGCSSCRRGF